MPRSKMFAQWGRGRAVLLAPYRPLAGAPERAHQARDALAKDAGEHRSTMPRWFSRRGRAVRRSRWVTVDSTARSPCATLRPQRGGHRAGRVRTADVDVAASTRAARGIDHGRGRAGPVACGRPHPAGGGAGRRSGGTARPRDRRDGSADHDGAGDRRRARRSTCATSPTSSAHGIRRRCVPTSWACCSFSTRRGRSNPSASPGSSSVELPAVLMSSSTPRRRSRWGAPSSSSRPRRPAGRARARGGRGCRRRPGVVERRASRAAGRRRSARRPPWCGQDRLHRLDRGGPSHRRTVR